MIRVCSLLLLILQHVYLFVCNRDNVLFDSVIYLITVFFFFWVSFGVWLSCYWILGLFGIYVTLVKFGLLLNQIYSL